jgi:hypothetical protein
MSWIAIDFMLVVLMDRGVGAGLESFILPYSTSLVVNYLLGREGFPVLALTPAATNERLLGSFFSAFRETVFSAKMPIRSFSRFVSSHITTA